MWSDNVCKKSMSANSLISNNHEMEQRVNNKGDKGAFSQIKERYFFELFWLNSLLWLHFKYLAAWLIRASQGNRLSTLYIREFHFKVISASTADF